MTHNEDSRVKIPALLHLVRLGYEYLPLRGTKRDETTNIFTDIFAASMARINPELEVGDITRLQEDVSLLLDNEDLGAAFYEKLLDQSGTKLLDFTDFNNNSFHVCTELRYKKDEDEFRPDVILLVNGMPLVFIEVKKPNNRKGVIAERDRINKRFRNKAFRKFVNITQLMIFSNNMEYDQFSIQPIQGAFYATTAYGAPQFNYFREEEEMDLQRLLLPPDKAVEDVILIDNNLQAIKQNNEFQTNKNPDSPTNRVLTSLCSRDRLAFLLRFAFVYVKDTKGLQKHVMRYPQLFATNAIAAALDRGIRKGIIWHTQGSGKTALAYFNVKYLTDYFTRQQVIPKFYFIVDRIDLATQAKKEFSSRGLKVHTVNSREEFQRDIKAKGAIHNFKGELEITVVNIQKFSSDSNVVRQRDYDISVQRIYFLDEVHRSYNPRGSFLANLTQSDPNSIKIGLTGTPLIGNEFQSKDLFGDYIHKYYYNASIADGYTLRLIREEIGTNYKIVLQEVLEKMEVLKGQINRKEMYARPEFVEPMLEYIITDFEEFRRRTLPTVGALVICDSSEQAKMMYDIFTTIYAQGADRIHDVAPENIAAEPRLAYKSKRIDASKVKTGALILHDIGTKQERKDWVDAYKDGNLDILFVYNMLLTGFDAKRLKKLYLGRVIKSHNLLQALTRVNRTYKNFEYGYVVDFADIRQEFDLTNKAYFDELKTELGDDLQHYSNIFKSKEEIEAEIEDIKDVLFRFDTDNAEVFSQQINQIEDRAQMLELKKILDNARSLRNIIKLLEHDELLTALDFDRITAMYRDVDNRLQLLNQREALNNQDEHTNLLTIALEDVLFLFTKLSEEELVLADELKDSIHRTRAAFERNFDKKDPQFIALYDELRRLFDRKKLEEVSQEEMKHNIGAFRKIYAKIKEINRINDQYRVKYNGDTKFVRIHKRLVERGNISKKERQLFAALQSIKTTADDDVLHNNAVLSNESYFAQLMLRMVIKKLKREHKIPLTAESAEYINKLVVKEYVNEYNNDERPTA